MSEKIFTLITGGSQGIGKGFALECASRGMNILIVALPGKELEETASLVKEKYKVEARTLAIDLTEKDAPQKVYKWCEQHNFNVDILINNAGIAGTTVFETSDLNYSDIRILLNIRALVLLTRLFIPMLKLHKKAYILNIGSLSAYYCIPYKAVYSASKAFVVNFSKAIKTELRNSSISVSVVNPNGVQTNEGSHERIKSHGLMGKLAQISPADLAKYSLEKMFKEKTVIIPKAINRFLLFLQKLIPYSLEQKILLKEFQKEVKVS